MSPNGFLGKRDGIDRRQFLGAAAATGAGAFLAACGTSGSSTIQKASSVRPAGSDLGAIEHVVFLMQENRSFDHYYGTYPGVNGFNHHPANSPGVFAQPFPANTTRPPKGYQLPFHLNTIKTNAAECIHDLTHNWRPQHECRANGKMNAFVEVHTSPQHEGPVNGVLTMGYYERSDLAYYYALADAFTICDAYHCSVLGPTHPNRLMAISGTIDPAGTHGGPVLITNPNPDARFSVNWTTMPEVLEDAGVTWKVYNPPGAAYQPTSPDVLAVTDSILPYFSQYSNPSSPLYKNAFASTFPTDFASDVKNGTLPKVSWIIPPLGYDEHPPAPPSRGEWFTEQVLSTLVSNEALWSKTVLFHMYDENDGFFDHVAPPVAPPGTPGEYVTVRPLPADAHQIAGPIGLGFRVPTLVISPFSRGGYICSETFDHTSQLRFLEARFGVKAPNISAWRRSTVGDLTGTLNMRSKNTTVPQLPPVSNSVAALTAQGCTSLDFVELATNQPPYPLPATQSVPRQEPGQRPHVPAT
ncbi:MAG: alkaline phosphatase family protein [Acidimicrobiales bacterium]